MKTNTQNKEDRIQNPEYVGDAIVLDKAEFARLIRKHCGLHVTLFVQDSDSVARCSSACTGFDISVKAALEKLTRSDFDAFEWRADENGPSIWHYAAPMHLQLQRRRDFIVARIPVTEARIARTNEHLANNDDASNRAWRINFRDSNVKQIASDRAEIARIDAQLLPAVPGTTLMVENGTACFVAA